MRLRELSFRRVWFRVRYVAGVRGGTGLVRIGRRARFFGSPREGFPILGIVDRDARAIAVRLFRAQDPPGLFGRSRRALGRTSSSSWATLTESSSASDRDTTSTLRAPPSPKWAHTSMSFFALMALGEAITRGAFATARIGSGGIRGTREAADDARGRASLRGAADCDGAANPPEDLPPTFVVALGKTWREFRCFAVADPLFLSATTTEPGLVWSSHRSPPAARTPVRVDSRSPRHDHAHLHARGGTSRASADAPARRSPHPTGARNQSYPKAEMPTARVPCRKRLPAVHAGPIEMKRVSRARACHSDHHEIRRRTLSRRDLRARPRCHATRADPSSRTMMMMRPEIRRNSVHLFLAFVRSRRTAPRTTAGCLSTATCTISRA